MATNDIGRVTPIWRGFYSAATTYELNDIVIDTAGSVWWHKSEEQTTGVIPEAGEIWDAVIDMSVFSALIQAAITTAQTAVQAAQEAESEVAEDVQRAETAAQSAEASAEAASESAAGVGALAQAAEQAKNAAQTAASQAAASASSAGASAASAGSSAQTAEAAKTAAAGSASDAQAWATGGSSGTPSATNNAKYWSEQAEATAEDIEDSSAQIAQNAADVAELKTQFDYAMDGIADEGAEVSGNIITVDSANGSVDYISVDASGAGTSVITRCGRNIYPKYSSGSSSGLSWTVDDDGEIEFTGTPTANVLLRHQNLSVPCTGKAFVLAANNTMVGTNNQLAIICKNPVGNWQTNLTSVNKTANHAVYQSSDAEFTEFQIKLEKDIDWTGLKMKPMLVVGDTFGDYEAYNGQAYNVTLVDGIVQESIPLIDGVNTLWASNGDITVKFDDVPNKIVDYVGSYVAEQIEPLCDRFFKYTVSGTTKKLNVYFRSGDRYIAYELHNMPANSSNSNTWQLGQTDAVKFNDDWTIAATTPLIDGGEYELAMRVHWTPQSESDTTKWDYCGGNNHGDENTVTFKLFIDGKQITDLDTNISFGRFNRIDAFEIATVNMPTNDSANNQYPENADIDIAKHQKHWTFENGKVEVQQSLEFLTDLSLDVVLLCMCCARSEQFPYGIRQGRVGIEDMSSENGFSHITTRTDDASYFYYGNNATLNIKADTDAPSPYSALYINSVRNSSQSQNKLYYGYYQSTNSGNPTQVYSGDTIRERSEYNAAYMM